MAIKVLIAEDDHFLVKAYQVKLEKEGFEVQIANDGEQALEILKSFVPDVIILDLVMPRKDGFATLAEIKQNPSLKDIPVVVASNLGQSEEIGRATELGATDVVTKSDMSLDALVTKIRSYVNIT
jgi:CheY-like chemotaxis protein